MSLYPPNAQNPYPKTKYAATGGSITIEDAHHEQLLGPGWSDNPYPVAAAAEPAPEPKKRSRVEANIYVETGGSTWPAAKGN